MTASRTKPDEPMGATGDHSAAESAAEAMKNPEEKAPATNDRALAWTDIPTLPALPRWPLDADGEVLRVDPGRDETPARARAVPPPPPPHVMRPRPAAQAIEDVNEEPIAPRTIEHFDLDDVLSRVSSIPPPPPSTRVDVPDAPRAYGALTAPPPTMRGPVPVSRILSYGALAGAVFVGAQMAIGAGLHSLARPSAATIAAAAKPAALMLSSARLRTMQGSRPEHEPPAVTLAGPSIETTSSLETEAPSDMPVGYSLDDAVGAPSLHAQPIDMQPIDMQPIDTQPIDTQPIDTQPIDTQPIDTQPTDTQPIDTPTEDAPPSMSSMSAVRASDGSPEESTESTTTGLPPTGSTDAVPAELVGSTPTTTPAAVELAKAEHAERIRRIRHRRILAIRAARAAGTESSGALAATPRGHARKPSPSR